METNWILFWRITFDVIEGAIRLQQEITWWEYDDQSGALLYTRRDRTVEDLPYRLVGDATVMRDHVVFRGGYLEARTLDLLAYAQKRLGVHIDLEELSQTLGQGENIAIRADVKLHPIGPVAYPIFYLPQSPADPALAVRLLVDEGGDLTRRVVWTISGQFLGSPGNYHLAHFDGWHAVRVRQDHDTRDGDFYEFLIDGAPMGDGPAAPPTHHFEPTPQTFYIGRTPELPDGLYGEVYHLDFDPNDSCGGCPRRPQPDSPHTNPVG
ncbi:hypothetical protein [Promineifilum sp.]|uniref:hypothetical protein n=1 Tax=Promineifilum sp. TaxID=2664178 RepID=UPI0035B42796